LSDVLPECQPWESSKDIQIGKSWWDELHTAIGDVKVSVVIVTPENIRSPWLFYEAGIIASKLDRALVCPYLVGVEGKSILGTPLAGYQWCESGKDGTLKLVHSLHSALSSPHDKGLLEGNFNHQWPRLKTKLAKVVESLEVIEDPVTQTDIPISQQLSAEAKRLLSKACSAEGQTGTIFFMPSQHLQAGNEELMGMEADARTQANWKATVEQLTDFGLIDGSGVEFHVNKRGWGVFDELNSAKSNS